MKIFANAIKKDMEKQKKICSPDLVAICDCRKEVKIVEAENDLCPLCGFYVYWKIIDKEAEKSGEHDL